ncbi:Acetyltransferase Pat [Paraconexibacter sp. AEG42_29]|uniref:Acetyltransferase Pat n=1 Tax=Paraconexibacter sp. AEG42_29 TaxID=2997339 RepID=A0AAU7AQ28_9ACTN
MLAIGSPVPGLTVRPIRPDDKAQLAAGLALLSEASIYRRFLAPKPRFTTTELRYLTEVDGLDHAALVAVDRTGALVAVGRYVRSQTDPESAEVAVVVADHLQGRGVGTWLGLQLADRARAAGILHFTAIMLPDNTAALRLLTRISAHLRTSYHDGVRELIADLAA